VWDRGHAVKGRGGKGHVLEPLGPKGLDAGHEQEVQHVRGLDLRVTTEDVGAVAHHLLGDATVGWCYGAAYRNLV
jgi:hypothetical protein